MLNVDKAGVGVLMSLSKYFGLQPPCFCPMAILVGLGTVIKNVCKAFSFMYLFNMTNTGIVLEASQDENIKT